MGVRRRRLVAEINVVPYIDVMLVLLIIFMVTAPLVTQGVKVDLPKAPSEPTEQADEPLILSIDKQGQFYLNIGDENQKITLADIKTKAGKIIAANPNIKVYVHGDKSVPYGQVVQAMSALQKAGAGSVGLITEPGAESK